MSCWVNDLSVVLVIETTSGLTFTLIDDDDGHKGWSKYSTWQEEEEKKNTCGDYYYILYLASKLIRSNNIETCLHLEAMSKKYWVFYKALNVIYEAFNPKVFELINDLGFSH
ncbi:hypothetical protein ACJX0J_013478 [Zea mays]